MVLSMGNTISILNQEVIFLQFELSSIREKSAIMRLFHFFSRKVRKGFAKIAKASYFFE
jgi:hypothetical protein